MTEILIDTNGRIIHVKPYILSRLFAKSQKFIDDNIEYIVVSCNEIKIDESSVILTLVENVKGWEPPIFSSRELGPL